MDPDDPKRAILTAGPGRGFVVGARHRFVVTATHCLPHLPQMAALTSHAERTYGALLAPLGKEPAITCECLFVDPVTDIAVLGAPEGQELYDEAAAYEDMVERAATLPIAEAPEWGAGFLLSVDGRWLPCNLSHYGGALWLSNAGDAIAGSVLGSPILTEYGEAVGVVCSVTGGASERHTEGGPHARLAANLPGWLLREIGA